MSSAFRTVDSHAMGLETCRVDESTRGERMKPYPLSRGHHQLLTRGEGRERDMGLISVGVTGGRAERMYK